MYRCRLVCLTPYACSPVIDGSVLTVVVRECIVVFGCVFSVPYVTFLRTVHSFLG